MNRYYIDGWSRDSTDQTPLQAMRVIINMLHRDIPHIMDWLVAMEIDHHFTIEEHDVGEPGVAYRRVYMIVPSDDDAFAIKMAWNFTPTPPGESVEEEEYMAINHRVGYF